MLMSTYKKRKFAETEGPCETFVQIERFYNLNVAFKNLSFENDRVWACDIWRASKEFGKKVLGKYFIVMSSINFYKYLCSGNKCLTWYEVILPNKPCNFHLDIELCVLHKSDLPSKEILLKRIMILFPDKSPQFLESIYKLYVEFATTKFDSPTITVLYDIIKNEVESFVSNEGGDIRCGTFLNSSRCNKFSLHYINYSLVLDRNTIAMKILSFAFSRYLWGRINMIIINVYNIAGKGSTNQLLSDRFLRAILRLAMLEKQVKSHGWSRMHNTPVDEVIYSKRRQFRLCYNSKMESPYFLRQCSDNTNGVMLCDMNTHPQVALDLIRSLGIEKFECLLVSRVVRVDSLSYFTPTDFPFDTQVTRMYRDEGLPMDNLFKTVSTSNVIEDFRKGFWCEQSLSNTSDSSVSKDTKATKEIFLDCGAKLSILENKKFFGPDGVEKQLKDFCDGDNLFHDCSEEGGHSKGTPSAFVINGSEKNIYLDNKFLFCFACHSTFAVQFIHEPTPYNCQHELHYGKHLKIPRNRVIMMKNKLCIIDAPGRQGEIHALDETEASARDTEGVLETFRSLYEETKELRMELKVEKEKHRVELEQMMAQLEETKSMRTLGEPTAVTLSTSAVRNESVIKDSSPSLKNRSRKRTR